VKRRIVTCKLTFMVCVVLISNGAASTASAEGDRPAKPNVVLIVADDLGWQDVKCYDVDEASVYDTPHLDSFAKKSVLFRQGYSPAPTCSPSRCAIISGNHPARAQKTHVTGGKPPAARSRQGKMMEPWYSGRMPEDTFTLAKAMKANGYVTGHVGKWHIAISHHAFPQPGDVGFDYTRSNRGAHSTKGMKDRLTGYSTTAEDDPFRLDQNGFPYHQNSEDALDFLRENKQEPFFLYYCTWLVHSPALTRSEALLKKYAERMRVEPSIKRNPGQGQKNPFYGAMVESLDYYMGKVFTYLETTPDPRWPGHHLSENTYVIFTSDNGGSTKYTDNTPLDLGKSSAKEGGTRVPLLIAGPGIPESVETDVMANGLDFYPTILSLTGSNPPAGKHLDGCDLAPLLLCDPTDSTLVKHTDGSVRETMMWHFPHGNDMRSTLIAGDFKLIRNYNHLVVDGRPQFELYQLSETTDGKRRRVDLEEAKNLATKMPERADQMNQTLTDLLVEMDASYPSYNPGCRSDLPNKESAPSVSKVGVNNGVVRVEYQEQGAKVRRAQLIYTRNAGETYEEWFRVVMEPVSKGVFTVQLPDGATHYFVNLIDENQFLISHPSLQDYQRNKTSYTDFALQPRD